MQSLSSDVLASLLSLGVLCAALLLFGAALAWARHRDRQSKEEQERQTQTILDLVEPWAGSRTAAWTWYRTYTISTFEGLTAEELIMRDRANDVIAYLFHIRQGGYA